MMLVYVAGKYRGETAWQVEQNIREAEELGFHLAETYGVVPVIPHTMYRHFDGELTDDFWLEGTLELMRRCDAIVMHPNWEDSSGAVGELEEAAEIGMESFIWGEDDDEFAAWIEEMQACDEAEVDDEEDED